MSYIGKNAEPYQVDDTWSNLLAMNTEMHTSTNPYDLAGIFNDFNLF